MRKLKIDLQDLAMAFEDSDFGNHRSFLDLETGRVIFIGEEFSHEDEFLDEDEFPDELEEEDEESFKESALGADRPGEASWMQKARAEARAVSEQFGTRYIAVPSDDSREAYRDMEAFIDTVEDGRLRERLERAIHGRGAFRRFRDVLSEEFHERDRWFRFKNDRVEERMRAWLLSEEIELIEEPDAREAKERQRIAELAQKREDLIAFVLAAVRDLSALPGVLRIALIGSLTTDRHDPKDADLLVTVADDIDLPSLAKLARRLQGRAQQLNRSADVFLLDANGGYLGRTCPWKDCRPGLRQSCEALHCGQRQYLYDDLQAVTLAKELTAAPPIELWPRIVARVPVPEDIKVGLIGEL
jgi:hypothetical protein